MVRETVPSINHPVSEIILTQVILCSTLDMDAPMRYRATSAAKFFLNEFMDWLSLPRNVCLTWHLSVYLTVSRITQKVVGKFWWNVLEECDVLLARMD